METKAEGPKQKETNQKGPPKEESSLLGAILGTLVTFSIFLFVIFNVPETVWYMIGSDGSKAIQVILLLVSLSIGSYLGQKYL